MNARKTLIILSVILFIFSTLFGVFMRYKTPDSGIISITSWDDLSSADITIKVPTYDSLILDNGEEESRNQIISEMKSAAVIMLVEVTEKIEFTTVGIGQTAIVERDVSDQLHSGDEIQIYYMNNLSLENEKMFYYGWYNYMIPGKKYLVFLQENELNDYQKKKVFQLISLSYPFPGFLAMDFDPDKSVPELSPFFSQNMDKVLFTENTDLIRFYDSVKEEAVSLLLQ